VFGIADYGAFCAAILVFLALPGPGTFALLTSTGQGGMRAGAWATLGVILGDQVLLWCAVAGVAALLHAHPDWFRALQFAGAGYLVWIGLRLVALRSASARRLRMESRRYARQALLITLLNPKAIVFYMAFFPLFIDPAKHRGAATFGAMAATIAAMTLAYGLALCATAAMVARRVRRHPALTLALKRLAGAALVGFGIRLGTQ